VDILTKNKYSRKIQTINQGGKEITIEHLLPVIGTSDLNQRKKIIEERLYDIFIKYENIMPDTLDK